MIFIHVVDDAILYFIETLFQVRIDIFDSHRVTD